MGKHWGRRPALVLANEAMRGVPADCRTSGVLVAKLAANRLLRTIYAAVFWARACMGRQVRHPPLGSIPASDEMSPIAFWSITLPVPHAWQRLGPKALPVAGRPLLASLE